MRKNLRNRVEACFKDFISKVWDIFGSVVNEEDSLVVPSSLLIKTLEISNYLLKENLYWSRIQLCNEISAYKVLCDLCRKFKANNMLHNQIFEVFKFAVHEAENEPSLVQKVTPARFRYSRKRGYSVSSSRRSTTGQCCTGAR